GAEGGAGLAVVRARLAEAMLPIEGHGGSRRRIGAPLRGGYLRWGRSAETSAFPPVGVIVWHTLYEGNADRFPEVMASARARAGDAMDFVARRLEGRPYLLGDEFSAADIMMGFTLFAARLLGVLDGRHAVLQRYLGRL